MSDEESLENRIRFNFFLLRLQPLVLLSSSLVSDHFDDSVIFCSASCCWLIFFPRRSSHEKPEEKKVNRTCCCFALNFRLVEVCDLANFSFLSSLKRSNSNQLRDLKFQFSLSFIARTHPQSLRQETSGRLRGPYDIFLLHTSIFTLRCEDCFALSKKGAPSSLRWQPVAF